MIGDLQSTELELARQDREQGQLEQALHRLEVLLNRAGQDGDEVLALNAQWELAQCLAAMGEGREAARAFAQVAENDTLRLASGSDVDDVTAGRMLRRLLTVGDFFISSGHTDDAETVLYTALSAAQERPNTEDFGQLEIGEMHVHLARIGEHRGDAAEAEEHYRRAVDCFRASDHAVVATRDEELGWALHRLGEVLQAQTRDSEAEPALLEAYTVLSRRYDPNAAELGVVLASLARLYEVSGRLDEAVTFFKRSITVGAGRQEAAVVAGRMTELAELYWRAGQHAQGEALFERAIDRMSEGLGSGHALVAEILQRMADLNWDIGRLDAAANACERALEMLDEVSESQQRDEFAIAIVLHQLASLRLEQGKLNAARLYGQRALEVFSEQLAGSAEHASCLNLLGQIARAMGDLDSAEPYLMDSIALMVRAAGEDDPRVITTVNNMAQVCLERGTPGNAEGLLRWALNVAAKHLGIQHAQVVLAVRLLVDVLTALDRADEARELLDWARSQ